MPKNITSVEWQAQDIPSGLAFDSQTGTFTGTGEEAGIFTIPVTVTTNYGTDTKDVKITIERRNYPLYVIGSKAEVRSEGAEADSEGWRKSRIPEGSRIINMSEGFIIKTKAGTYVCGNIDITLEQYQALQTSLNYYEVPTLKEEYADLVNAVNGWVYSANAYNNETEHYFFWQDKDGLLRRQYTATDGYGANWGNKRQVFLNHGTVGDFNDEYDYYLIYPEQTGAIVFYTVAPDVQMYIKYGSYMLKWQMCSISPDINIKKIIETFQGISARESSSVILSTDGRIIQVSTSGTYNKKELETGIENIKNIWSTRYTAFIQDESNNLYVRGTFGEDTYSEFTQIGSYDVKKLLQAGNAVVILTKDGELYYAGQCASIPAMSNQANEFTQIYPQYSFYDVHLESADMAALIKSGGE